MSNYILRVKNNSTNNTRFAVFQKAPDTVSGKNVFTLAWFSKYAFKTTVAEFGWEIKYSAIWSRPGQQLRPGVVCRTSQNIPVDINSNNTANLQYNKDYDAFNFEPLTPGAKGSIFTNCDASVPNSKLVPSAAAGVGIGMSGAGTFLAETQPNLNLTWTPKPSYYLVAGGYKTGEILDVQTILGNAYKIEFKGVTTFEITLNENNEWVEGITD
jgi:hypothetical protein